MEEAPNEADRKPESVTPICTVERKVFGSRAILATLAPRASSCSICSICEPRRETNANSVPENTEPITRNTKIRRMFKPSDMPSTLGERHVKLGCAGWAVRNSAKGRAFSSPSMRRKRPRMMIWWLLLQPCSTSLRMPMKVIRLMRIRRALPSCLLACHI